MKVLVIGGDEDEQELIRASLSGVQADLVLSWSESLEDGASGIAEGGCPDVVLLDGKLVESGAAAAFKKFSTSGVMLPVVVFCAVDSEQRTRELMHCGADDVMGKADLSTARLRKTVLRSADRSSHAAEVLSQVGEFALSQMSEGVVAIDKANRIVLWSAGMERMFEIPASRAAGRVLTSVLPFIRNDEKTINEARAGKSASGMVHQFFVQPRGSHVRLKFDFAPLNAIGHEQGVILCAHELDSASDMEQNANLVHQRLRLVADGMAGLVWLCDHNGERFLFNSKWLEFTGRELSQERGRGWLSNVDRQDMHRVWRVCSAALAAHASYHVQYKLRRADGQHRLILESAVPQFSTDGTFIGMMGSCNDVSATRVTQQRLSSPVSPGMNFSSTLDHAPIAIWRLDRDLVIRKANAAVASMLGMDSENIVNRPFSDVVPSLPLSSFNPVLDEGERLHLENYPVVLNNDKEVRKSVWDIVAWPLKDDEGKVLGVCMSSSEISERQQKTQQRDDFVAALVHDLKTPLIGADRTLEQMINGALGGLDRGQTDVLNMLRRSNHQLLLMVQNLIEVYRYEAGTPSLSYERTDISAVFRNAISELIALAQHKGVEIVSSLPDSVYIEADQLAVRRVFLNLMDNALKFTSRGGKVTITSDFTPDWMILLVSDTGLGIAEADQKKLFQQFWQSESSKRYAPGTGLGLYLCKQIVNAHKGTISVHSEEGKGSTFSVRLPTSQAVVAANRTVDVTSSHERFE